MKYPLLVAALVSTGCASSMDMAEYDTGALAPTDATSGSVSTVLYLDVYPADAGSSEGVFRALPQSVGPQACLDTAHPIPPQIQDLSQWLRSMLRPAPGLKKVAS